MARPLDLAVVVAGAGAVGSVLALTLARGGARVTLVDPAPLGANASAIAAGMLAPAFEAILDGPAIRFGLLREARDRWRALAPSIGLPLERAGATGIGSADELDRWEAGLIDIGAPVLRLTAARAQSRWPWLHAQNGAVLTGEDWRIEPGAALAALHQAATAAGARIVRGAVVDFEPGRAVLTDGTPIVAEVLAIATGASTSLASLAPELAVLTPIKGQILRARGAAMSGPVIRLARGYICPSADGALVGATMETGRSDAGTDDATLRGLQAMAAAAAPRLAGAIVKGFAGVRAATPDGLPMVGPSRASGVWLAVGARRNGWLLAPLIAETLLAALAGAGGGEALGLFDPARF